MHLKASQVLLLGLSLLLWAAGWVANAESSAENTKRIVDQMLINYTRQNSPNGDATTNVYIGIYIIEFYSISEATLDYSLTLYLRQQWTDPRLRFNSSQVGGKTQIKLEDNIWDKIWVPDVFLRNEKKADFHSVTVPNRFMNLRSDGRIWYVIKLSVTLSCEMDLMKYPLDTQFCPMIFESFGHTMDTVAFHWLQPPKRPDGIPADLTMPQFELRKVHMRSCDLNYTTGAYPCLQMTFELKRDFGYFFIQIYLPTMLIVILSWFAFWLNIDAVPARVSLGLLTVLTIMFQALGSKSSLPKVSYIKAIDVWMSACLGFVFASLLEFVIVNVYSRQGSNVNGGVDREKRTSTVRSRKAIVTAAFRRRFGAFFQTSQQESPLFVNDRHEAAAAPPASAAAGTAGHDVTGIEMEENMLGIDKQQPQQQPQQPQQQQSMAKRIDKFSRRMFPLAFLIFNLAYWVYYVFIA